MNKDVLKFIDQIISKVTKADISALEVEVEGIKVRAERQTVVEPVIAPIMGSLQSGHAIAQVQNQEIKATATAGKKDERTVIKSPIVGTFYLTPSPNEEPFVKVGAKVSKGQAVCIIEAMKIMNEIESDFDGIVQEILVDTGQTVEYGQPLIVIA